MRKRSYGSSIATPPDERGGNSCDGPTATAPHLDSTPADFVNRQLNRRHVWSTGTATLALPVPRLGLANKHRIPSDTIKTLGIGSSHMYRRPRVTSPRNIHGRRVDTAVSIQTSRSRGHRSSRCQRSDKHRYLALRVRSPASLRFPRLKYFGRLPTLAIGLLYANSARIERRTDRSSSPGANRWRSSKECGS
jgi:hypothetical protein